MTGSGPDHGPRPFSMRDLGDISDATPDELAAEAGVARELEGLTERSGAAPGTDFAERVMSAVSREPTPAPARAAGIALRRGALAAFVASLRDAWRVTTRSGFPIAVRAQALALVLVVAGLAAGSGLATAGALGLFDADRGSPSPEPTVEVPSPTPTIDTPSPTAPPSPSTEPSDSAEPTVTTDTETPEPSGPEETDGEDQGGRRSRRRARRRPP